MLRPLCLKTRPLAALIVLSLWAASALAQDSAPAKAAAAPETKTAAPTKPESKFPEWSKVTEGAKKLEGEIVIGAEVAQREAAERGHDLQSELCLYVIHGVLHLCGYDDGTKRKAAEMRRKERQYLKQLNLPDIADE